MILQTWYHSHFSTQVIDGLAGPIMINGPATADYDEHLGALFLSDWDHGTAAEMWESIEKYGLFPTIPNGLINGTNTFDCSGSTNDACLGTGKRFELTFTPGKKYRIGLVGTQADGFFRFAIDGHNLTVISNDLVPVIPYVTDSVVLGGGQRYDIVVEALPANEAVGSYWMRSILESCNIILNSNGNNIKGIVRYEGVGDSTAEPTTTISSTVPNTCYDTSLSSLVPYLNKTVGSATSEDSLSVGWYYDILGGLVYHWTINSQALELDWTEPTLKMVQDETSSFPSDYAINDISAVNQVSFQSSLSLRAPELTSLSGFTSLSKTSHC